MSNKIIRAKGRYYLTWLAPHGINCWGAIAASSEAEMTCYTPLGADRGDNHCGAAIVKDTAGRVQAVLGAHHGQFAYRSMLDYPASWTEPIAIAEKATYPCLVCDRAGTLHLAYRCRGTDRWLLCYLHKRPGQPWSTARQLVVAAVPGYVYWTNALAVGPDNHLHLVLGVYRRLNNGYAYHGAAHVYSCDGGCTWRQYGKPGSLPTPIEIDDLNPIEQDFLNPARMVSPADLLNEQPGPYSLHYLKLLLSNVTVDAAGRPWVVVHNGLTRSAAVYSGSPSGWIGIPLEAEVARLLPGYGIGVQSSISQHQDGTIEVVAMAAPMAKRAWGDPETELVHILLNNKERRIVASEIICAPDPHQAHWLPSLEHWDWNWPISQPALLYTSGVNAGGFQHNDNATCNEIWFVPRDR